MAMTKKTCVLIGKVDVTEHVAAMYDAIVGSLDWGSGFLTVETIESILIVAALAGFNVDGINSVDVNILPQDEPPLPPYPKLEVPFGGWPADTTIYDDAHRKYKEDLRAYDKAQIARLQTRCNAITKWREQVRAKILAMSDSNE